MDIKITLCSSKTTDEGQASQVTIRSNNLANLVSREKAEGVQTSVPAQARCTSRVREAVLIKAALSPRPEKPRAKAGLFLQALGRFHCLGPPGEFEGMVRDPCYRTPGFKIIGRGQSDLVLRQAV